MKHDTFEKLLSTYGANAARWPTDVRAAALAFAQENPEFAARVNAHALELDTQLDQNVKRVNSNALLMARILETARNTPQDKMAVNDRATPLPSLHSQWKQLAATLIITASVGFITAKSITTASPYTTGQQLLALNQDMDAASNNWLEILP